MKNKVAPPFRIAEFDMMHTNGISYEGDVLDLGVAQKVVARSGSWFKYGDTHLGQGKEKARQFLIDNRADRRGNQGESARCRRLCGSDPRATSADELADAE